MEKDVSNLKNVKNVKGDETYTVNEDNAYNDFLSRTACVGNNINGFIFAELFESLFSCACLLNSLNRTSRKAQIKL